MIFVFFISTDDDMPLNLSTKPSTPSPTVSIQSNRTPTLSVSNLTGVAHHSNIWSPASMCEKETATESESEQFTKRLLLKSSHHKFEPTNFRYQLDSRLLNTAAYSSSNSVAGRFDSVTTDSDEDTHTSYCASINPNRTNDNSDNNNLVYSPFSSKVGLLNQFHKHRDMHMLRQNRTDIFVVNNNNEYLRDKEVPIRPDSTAHSDIMSKSGLDERKREHRCFEVSSTKKQIYFTYI